MTFFIIIFTGKKNINYLSTSVCIIWCNARAQSIVPTYLPTQNPLSTAKRVNYIIKYILYVYVLARNKNNDFLIYMNNNIMIYEQR